jgi:SAM-dependent MidA family methyltransferase
VHLVESSRPLRALQEAALADAGVAAHWHPDLEEALSAGSAPKIVLANEYLDALPVEQLVWHHGAWHERCVGLDSSGDLAWCLSSHPLAAGSGWNELAARAGTNADGAVLEVSPEIAAVARALAAFARQAPLAALLIDYGHMESALGETLQGVRDHRQASPLSRPGETDLTAHVDFAALVRAASAQRLAVDGPIMQAELLGRLGIIERASRLMSANPAKAATIEAGISRLLAPNGMGTRFKAIGLRSPRLPALPGFA